MNIIKYNISQDKYNEIFSYYQLGEYTDKQIIDYFKDKYKTDITQLFREWNNQKDPSLTLAEIARDLWYENMSVDNFKEFINKGLGEVLIGKLFDNLKHTFDRLKIVNHIAELISKYVDNFRKIERAKELISDVSASVINNFVTSSGWEFFDTYEKEDLKSTCEKNKLIFKAPTNEELVNEALNVEEISNLFDFIDTMNVSMSNSTIDASIRTKVPVIKNYTKWVDLMQLSFVANCKTPTYDIEGNKRIGEIIRNIKTLNDPQLNPL